MANLTEGRPSKETVQNCTVSLEDAAQSLTVSRRSAARAKDVLAHGSDELIEAVEQCQVSVSLAGTLCREVLSLAVDH